jgi:hypothetical protein
MRATKETTAGRKYLELQREARRTGRPTDELIQLYALECFLDRLTHSEYLQNFVLKGGMLLAALNARRPTRDIDFAARAIDNDTDEVSRVVRQIAAISLDDGIEFDGANANAETIREEDAYSGVRVTLSGTLSRATLRLHVSGGARTLAGVEQSVRHVGRGGKLGLESDTGDRLNMKGFESDLVRDWNLDIEARARYTQRSIRAPRKPPKLVHNRNSF